MSSDDEETLPPAEPDAALNLPALFWDHVPEGAEQHADYAAMQALAEESTPEERAENFKRLGNEKLKMGLKVSNKHVLRDAIEFYSRGVALKCSDAALHSLLLGNRAQAHLTLGNWRRALDDAQDAVKCDPENVKAYFRGAKAALKLSEWAACEALCAAGAQRDPAAAEFGTMQAQAKEQRLKKEEEDRKAREAEEKIMRPARELAAAILKKGYRVTRPQIKVGNRKPYVDDAGDLHWPAVVMYPEPAQQDMIEDFCESNTIGDHLDAMFGPDAPPVGWDERNEYTRQRLELYYLSNAGAALSDSQLAEALAGRWPEGVAEAGPKRYGKDAARWVKVDERQTLHQVMNRPDFVIPGIPVFFAVAKGTDYRERFLAEELKR